MSHDTGPTSHQVVDGEASAARLTNNFLDAAAAPYARKDTFCHGCDQVAVRRASRPVPDGWYKIIFGGLADAKTVGMYCSARCIAISVGGARELAARKLDRLDDRI